jgi:D-inositol-3-phosphate glycosyltransferase
MDTNKKELPPRKRKLLFVGDAGVSTGFAKCAHEYIAALDPAYEIVVLGLGYVGDPHGLKWPVYSAGAGGDGLGIARTKEMMDRFRPDVVVVQNDPWNFQHYLRQVKREVPVVGIVAVDGLNCNGAAMNGVASPLLAKTAAAVGLRGAIFWTKFGEQQAREGGYRGASAVVPLGVDTERYKPQDRTQLRTEWALDKLLAQNGLPPDSFIVGYVGRNQHRKRLDLLVKYFADWVKTYEREDAALWIQRAPTGEQAFDLQQLASYYGVGSRLLLPGVSTDNHGVSEDVLVKVYGVFDIMATTTQGEGWGLPQMEGMACGIPQVVPDWSGLGEWTRDAAVLVPCDSTAATPNGPNTIGGIANQRLFCSALDSLYTLPSMREEHREAGLRLVSRDEYRWKNVGAAMAAAIEQVLAAPAPPQAQQQKQQQEAMA